MRKIILFLVSFLLYSTAINYAQNKVKIIAIGDDDPTPILYKWLDSDSKELTKMGIVYQKPEGFNETEDGECFKEYPNLERAFSCIDNLLRSDDGQFLAFMPIFRPLTLADSIRIEEMFPNHSIGNLDTEHLKQMRAVLRDYYQEEVDLKKIMKYYPQDMVKNQFNADTIIRFTIPLRKEDYYKKKFKHVDVLILQKNRQGYVNFYCFYTDKAKKNLDFYWKKIEGVLRYEK